jgi:pilus assembly protein CpaB
MNWKTWVPLIIAVILGLIAAKVGRDMLVNRKDVGPEGHLVRIVVAKRDIAPGHTLDANDLTSAAFPPDSIPRGSFRQESELAGRVAALQVIQGQPLLDSFLAMTGSGAGVQAIVPPGMRAVTVEVNEFSGVAGLLVPGCRVDVVSTLPDQQTKVSIARTIVQNVKVLAVGQRLTVNNAGAKNESAMSAEAAVARSVTLLVKPREAEAIELASSSGRTRLVLRGSFDEGLRQGEGVSVAELLGSRPQAAQQVQTAFVERPTTQPTTRPLVEQTVVSAQQPEYEPPPARKHVVEFIRGTKLTRGEFEFSVDADGNEVTGTKEVQQEIEN